MGRNRDDDDDRRRTRKPPRDRDAEDRGKVIQFKPAPGKMTRTESEGNSAPGHQDASAAWNFDGPRESGGAWEANQGLLDAFGLGEETAAPAANIDRPAELDEQRATIDDSPEGRDERAARVIDDAVPRDPNRAAVTIDRPAELDEQRATIDDSPEGRTERAARVTDEPVPRDPGRAAVTIDRPAELDEQRATIDDSPEGRAERAARGAGQPSAQAQTTEASWVVRARAYHRTHPERVQRFNALTANACADGDSVDPAAVARWQVEHGVLADGRVGRDTLRAARRASPDMGARVQRKADRTEPSGTDVHATAAAGVQGSGSTLPHLEAIQASFGAHDIRHVRAHVGGDAGEAAHTIGAEAYATGRDVAFASPPSLHTAAHEAAHVVQQRAGVQLKGGVGEAGDAHEQHADAVADAVVAGKSAESLLDQGSGSGGGTMAVQRRGSQASKTSSAERKLEALESQLDLVEDLGPAFMARLAAPDVMVLAGLLDAHLQRLEDLRAQIRGSRATVRRSGLESAADDALARADTLLKTYKPVVETILNRVAGASYLDDEANESADEPRASHLDDEEERTSTDGPSADPFGLGYDAGLAHELPDACIVDTPTVAADAVSGVHLWLHFDQAIYRKVDQSPKSYKFGPDRAGPYKINPYTRKGELMFFIALHTERDQFEWVIGPDSVWSFAGSVDLYAGAAAQLLPGSANVPGSQADGADAVQDPDSVVKQEALSKAPWQAAADFADEAADYLGGGGGLLNAGRNARIRMQQYVKPARELSQKLAAELAAGNIGHFDARGQAVEGRNAILDDTRKQQSPAARVLSSKLKEKGTPLEEMVERKTDDLLKGYKMGPDQLAKRRLPANLKELLDKDNVLWAKYAEAVTSVKSEIFKEALRDLGDSPEVSKAIVQSAGKTNRWVTGIARWGGPAALVLGLAGAADMILDIADAESLHAAAGEFAGFVGGVVGGELGAAGMVFLASALTGVGGIVIVASIFGGFGGAVAGSLGGKALVDLLAQGAAPTGFATGLGPAGGFAGRHSKDHPAGYRADRQLADTIEATTKELDTVAQAIPQAQSRVELEILQKARLEILARRQHMEDLLTAIKLGAFDEMQSPVPQEPEPVPPPSPEAVACAVDNDCDVEVD